MTNASQLFHGLKKGMKDFGSCISTLINSILLTAVYLIGVGLTATVAKLKRKHFLDMELDKKSKTYWSELNLKKKPVDDYYRQF